jgi:hypothetical protein
MPRSKVVSRESAISHVVGWVGKLSCPEHGIQPGGATQAVLSNYTRFAQSHVSALLRDAIRMGIVEKTARHGEHGEHSPSRYALTSAGEKFVNANSRMIEKIDQTIEMAWLMDAQND